MFYIKLDDEMNLVITVKDTLRRGDNLSKKVIYLIPKELDDGEIDPLSASFYLSFLRADGNADVVELERLPEMYNETYYQFTFPITCRLTRFAGEVITWMQIYDGSIELPRVAKSGECVLHIEDSKNADDYLYPDQIVTALYQFKKKTNEQIDEANEHIGQNSEAISENSDAIAQNADAIAQNVDAINQNADAIRAVIDDLGALYQFVAEKADGLIFDAETSTLQLTAGGAPIGNAVIISAATGKGIASVSITLEGDLLVFFTDGSYTNVGKVVGDDGKVYVPHIDAHKILTFTIEDEPGEIPDPTDLNPDDEWHDIDDAGGESDYTWEGIGD